MPGLHTTTCRSQICCLVLIPSGSARHVATWHGVEVSSPVRSSAEAPPQHICTITGSRPYIQHVLKALWVQLDDSKRLLLQLAVPRDQTRERMASALRWHLKAIAPASSVHAEDNHQNNETGRLVISVSAEYLVATKMLKVIDHCFGNCQELHHLADLAKPVACTAPPLMLFRATKAAEPSQASERPAVRGGFQGFGPRADVAKPAVSAAEGMQRRTLAEHAPGEEAQNLEAAGFRGCRPRAEIAKHAVAAAEGMQLRMQLLKAAKAAESSQALAEAARCEEADLEEAYLEAGDLEGGVPFRALHEIGADILSFVRMSW